MDDLQPCPFCGSSQVWLLGCGDAEPNSIVCDACGVVVTGSGFDEATVVAAWNRRPAVSAAAPDIVAELRNGWTGECEYCKDDAVVMHLCRDRDKCQWEPDVRQRAAKEIERLRDRVRLLDQFDEGVHL